jgi:hypothetical protein
MPSTMAVGPLATIALLNSHPVHETMFAQHGLAVLVRQLYLPEGVGRVELAGYSRGMEGVEQVELATSADSQTLFEHDVPGDA